MANTPGNAAADMLSIPTTGAGLVGQEARVALSVAGASGFIAVDVDIAFNKNVIVAKGVELGLLGEASNCFVESNIPDPPDPAMSEISMGLVCSTPVSGAGQLLQLVFTVVGGEGSTSPLTFTFCSINEGAIPCGTTNGQLTVFASVNVSGKIVYYNGLATTPAVAQQRPVDGATISLLGALTASTTTAAAGTYTIPTARSSQATVRPEKLGGINDAITSFDAALVARHLVGLGTPLNARQRIAAETSGNHLLTSFDAQRIAQLRVGIRDQLAMGDDCDTDFVFLPEAASVPTQTIQQPNTDVRPPPAGPGCVYGQISYSSLGANAANQNFVAILIGDVSGNWQPGGAPLTASSTIGTPEGQGAGQTDARLSVGKKVAKSGATVTVPVRITRAQGVIGVDLKLQYAADVLVPLAVNKTSLSQDMTLVTSLDEPGLIQIGLFSPEELRRSGELVEVTFAVIGDKGEQSAIELIEALVNESQAAAQSGAVRIR